MSSSSSCMGLYIYLYTNKIDDTFVRAKTKECIFYPFRPSKYNIATPTVTAFSNCVVAIVSCLERNKNTNTICTKLFIHCNGDGCTRDRHTSSFLVHTQTHTERRQWNSSLHLIIRDVYITKIKEKYEIAESTTKNVINFSHMLVDTRSICSQFTIHAILFV